MDFCTRCGNELTSEDQICGKCGKDVRAKRATVDFIHDHPKEEHVKGAIDEGMKKETKRSWIGLEPKTLIISAVSLILTGWLLEMSTSRFGGWENLIIRIPVVGMLVAIPAVILSRRRGTGFLNTLVLYTAIVTLSLQLLGEFLSLVG